MSSPTLLNRLTFRQLQVFQAVHQQRSYSRAAEQLGLTQPAVSAQIRQLEQALGSLLSMRGKLSTCCQRPIHWPSLRGKSLVAVAAANEPFRH